MAMSMSTMPTVAFGEGRRPESATHVTLPAFACAVPCSTSLLVPAVVMAELACLPYVTVIVPVVAVPVPLTPLPVGVQLVTAPWREDIGLRVAQALEKEKVVGAPRPPR